MDKSRVWQPLRAQLVISFHKRRYGKLEASIDIPLPKTRKREAFPPQNIILEALRVKEFMTAHPDETCLSAVAKLNINRRRISKLLTIAETLPPNLITKLANCNDPQTLRQMHLKRLLDLAKR